MDLEDLLGPLAGAPSLHDLPMDLADLMIRPPPPLLELPPQELPMDLTDLMGPPSAFKEMPELQIDLDDWDDLPGPPSTASEPPIPPLRIPPVGPVTAQRPPAGPAHKPTSRPSTGAARPTVPPASRPTAPRPPPVLGAPVFEKASAAAPSPPELPPETQTSAALPVAPSPRTVTARPPGAALASAPRVGSVDAGGLTPEQLVDLLDRSARLSELDYFQVLKLETSATPADIKRAFYRESRTYHPDRFFQLKDELIKDRVHDLYKRVTEAYFVLRDDTKRRRYVTEISGTERTQKLRFSDVSEVETKAAAKKEHDEEIGMHPKGRQFFKTALSAIDEERWEPAERSLKMAMTYEPQNARYKERLAFVQKQLQELAKADPFKIK